MRRHDLDPLSFLFGLLFLAVGLVILGGDPAGGSVAFAWAGPAAAIAIAVIIVLAIRPRRSTSDTGRPTESTADGELGST